MMSDDRHQENNQQNDGKSLLRESPDDVQIRKSPSHHGSSEINSPQHLFTTVSDLKFSNTIQSILFLHDQQCVMVMFLLIRIHTLPYK